MRHSDWSRYAKTARAPRLGIWLVGPLAVTMTGLVGVLVTSAAKQMYGTAIWNPITLLLYVQNTTYTPASRAGTFFGGLGWFLSQLAVNISLNAVAAGMDLAAALPKFLTNRRGGLLLAVVGLAVCPWNYVNSATTFTTVLSSFGMFLSPLLGIFISDFWVIRKCKWRVPDLYIGDETSIYWFTGGFHVRAFLIWIFSVWPSLPGFAKAVNPSLDLAQGWTRVFQISFFVGKMCPVVLTLEFSCSRSMLTRPNFQ
jgi:NCS1 family nucleobase:cation symporter-1